MNYIGSDFNLSQGTPDPFIAIVDDVYNQTYLNVSSHLFQDDLLDCADISHFLLDQFHPKRNVPPIHDILDVEIFWLTHVE